MCLVGYHEDVPVYYETLRHLVQREFRDISVVQLLFLRNPQHENLDILVLMHSCKKRTLRGLSRLTVWLKIEYIWLHKQLID
jgi:hypothetical protein